MKSASTQVKQRLKQAGLICQQALGIKPTLGTSPGVLDLIEFASGNSKIFRQPGVYEADIKKIVIISLDYCGQEVRDEVAFLQFLKKNEFQVYVCINNQVVELADTSNEEGVSSLLKNSVWMYQRDIIKALMVGDNKITSDRCLVLNYTGLQELTNKFIRQSSEAIIIDIDVVRSNLKSDAEVQLFLNRLDERHQFYIKLGKQNTYSEGLQKILIEFLANYKRLLVTKHSGWLLKKIKLSTLTALYLGNAIGLLESRLKQFGNLKELRIDQGFMELVSDDLVFSNSYTQIAALINTNKWIEHLDLDIFIPDDDYSQSKLDIELAYLRVMRLRGSQNYYSWNGVCLEKIEEVDFKCISTRSILDFNKLRIVYVSNEVEQKCIPDHSAVLVTMDSSSHSIGEDEKYISDDASTADINDSSENSNNNNNNHIQSTNKISNTINQAQNPNNVKDSTQENSDNVNGRVSREQCGFKLDNKINHSNHDQNVIGPDYFNFKEGQKQFPSNYYRIGVFDEVVLDETSIYMKPIAGALIRPVKLSQAVKYNEANLNHYEGKVTLPANSTAWYPLPILSAYDELLSLSQYNNPSVEFGKSEKHNAYFVRLKNSSSVNVVVPFAILHDDKINSNKPLRVQGSNNSNNNNNNYNYSFEVKSNGVNVTSGDRRKLVNPSFEELSSFLTTYFDFKDLDKEPVKVDEGGIGVVNLILREKRGACRHRTIAAMVLAQHLGWKMRAVTSDVHAFVELWDPKTNRWRSICLGGWPNRAEPKPGEETQLEFQQKPKDSVSSKTQIKDHSLQQRQLKFDDNFIGRLLCASANLEPGRKNTLCFMDKSQIEFFYKSLLVQCKSSGQKVYFISDLEDVKERSYEPNRDGELVEVDSDLVNFVKNAEFGDILVINRCDDKPKYVGLNTITDADQRTILGFKIPQNMIVISLHDDPKAVSEDFYSRHRHVKYFPREFMGDPLKVREIATLGEGEYSYRIEEIQFFDEPWRESLFGSYSIEKGKFLLNPSAFQEALKRRADEVVFRHAPWHLMDFRLAVIKLMSERPRIKIYRSNEPYSQKDLVRSGDEMADIGRLNKRSLIPKSGPNCYLLNQQTLSTFFQTYAIDSHGQLSINPGIVKRVAAVAKTILIVLTGPIPELAWIRLVNSFNQENVFFTKIFYCGDLELPDLKSLNQEIECVKENTMMMSSASQIITSNDPDFTCEKLPKDQKSNTYVIVVSEQTTYGDLIEQFIPDPNNNANTRKLIYVEGVLIKAIREGKNVILMGDLSDQLALQLQSLFFDSRYYIANGNVLTVPEKFKLTLITRRNNIYAFSNIEPVREYSQDEYFEVLKCNYKGKIDDQLIDRLQAAIKAFSSENFTYSQLNEMVKLLQADPARNPLKSFLRLHPDYLSSLKEKAEKVWGRKPKTVKDEMQKRIDKIKRELKHSPYVFIAGASGIGKSHLIIQALPGHNVHVGMDGIEAWLKSDSDILFIDEANLEVPGMLDVFLGLMSSPPTILWKGQLCDIGQRKVIFAGNFSTFSGRMSHSLFQQYGHVVTFKEFSVDYLKSKILEPVWKNFNLPKVSFDQFSALILKYYIECNSRDPKRRPLTIRNLQMMVSRIAYYHSTGIVLNASVNVALHEELRRLLNEDDKKKLSTNVVDDLKRLNQQTVQSMQHYVTTKSRHNPLRLLAASLNLRQFLIEHNKTEWSTHGVLIEGESGIGKTKMVTAYLESNTIPFIQITPTDPAEMERVLLEAFHAGKVVVIDEVNTLPIEKLLNALLSGVDHLGNKAQNPGFFVIGTMNPSYFANRIALSDALLNRFYKIDMPVYPMQELVEIVVSIVKSKTIAMELVKNYEIKTKRAEVDNERVPTPRDLFAWAKEAKSKSQIGNNSRRR